MNLVQMGRAIAIYQAENDDQFPPNLDVLLDDDDALSPRALRCPADSTPDAQLNGGSSYFYCAPEDEADSTTIIACDVAPVHPRHRGSNNARNYLRADLSVHPCTEPEFQQLLQQPENSRFAEELAKGVNLTPQERVTYIAPQGETP